MGEDASSLFLLFSAVIALGFLGYLFFERTRISDVLALVAFGALVGPGLHLIAPETFTAAAPFITSFALAMILFGGGLELNIAELARGAARGTFLSIFGFTTATLAVAAVAWRLLHFGILESVLVGFIFAHTSSVVVFPLLSRLNTSERTRVMLGIDSALGEVLSVVLALTLAEGIALNDAQIGHAFRQIASQFSVAIVLGLVVGLLWSKLLAGLEKKHYNYMLTLAVLLALHVGVASLGGSGPIAVLVFGVVLGNTGVIRRAGLAVGDFSPKMREFQDEISFFLRTFFFVYLGLTVDLAVVTTRVFWLVAGAFVGALLVARIIAVALSLAGTERGGRDIGLMATMIPRGLAVAVLAGIPFAGYGLSFARDLPAYAVGVILLSNFVTTVGVFLAGRGARAATAAATPVAPAP
ncbi:MAG: cation:proton antiporter domain-containing protein [Thermoplasmatota archaeon]